MKKKITLIKLKNFVEKDFVISRVIKNVRSVRITSN